jgi:hypothetical protein
VGEVLSVGFLLLAGVGCIAFGIYLTFGSGPAVIAVGIACLLAAFITMRGLSRA